MKESAGAQEWQDDVEIHGESIAPSGRDAPGALDGAGAHVRVRTGDLFLTKEVLCLLSYVGPFRGASRGQRVAAVSQDRPILSNHRSILVNLARDPRSLAGPLRRSSDGKRGGQGGNRTPTVERRLIYSQRSSPPAQPTHGIEPARGASPAAPEYIERRDRASTAGDAMARHNAEPATRGPRCARARALAIACLACSSSPAWAGGATSPPECGLFRDYALRSRRRSPAGRVAFGVRRLPGRVASPGSELGPPPTRHYRTPGGAPTPRRRNGGVTRPVFAAACTITGTLEGPDVRPGREARHCRSPLHPRRTARHQRWSRH